MSVVPKPRLRLITYMCPSHPVELYELILRYLEEVTGHEASLLYESRCSGPLPDRVDPFTDDLVDIGFMSSSSYIKLVDQHNEHVELLPVAAVFQHTKNTNTESGYYADVIIHADGRKHVKEFLDLRGCRWAFSDENSLSGNTVIVKMLKDLGENAIFFGNALKSGSHLSSLQMVLSKQAEAAAVDANTLAYNKKYLQDGGRDIVVLDSIGPLPPYPVVVNSRLSGSMKMKLTRAFLDMHKSPQWCTQFNKFGVLKFVANSTHMYDKERELNDDIKHLNLQLRYY